MKEIVKELPQYDYLYLGDNARAPYGTRSFETVHRYTWEAVQWFFKKGCSLVILACNTASAKALRTIQQQDLKEKFEDKRVLGVIRPTAEVIGTYTRSGSVGVLATRGTVDSRSYLLEIEKFAPGTVVTQEACPIWVPLVEYNEIDNPGTDYFVQKHLNNLLAGDPSIDTILLACTHYPILIRTIERNLKSGIKVISQGEIVAKSLANYLKRHPEIEQKCSKGAERQFFTTDSPIDFDQKAETFYGQRIHSSFADLSYPQ